MSSRLVCLCDSCGCEAAGDSAVLGWQDAECPAQKFDLCAACSRGVLGALRMWLRHVGADDGSRDDRSAGEGRRL